MPKNATISTISIFSDKYRSCLLVMGSEDLATSSEDLATCSEELATCSEVLAIDLPAAYTMLRDWEALTRCRARCRARCQGIPRERGSLPPGRPW